MRYPSKEQVVPRIVGVVLVARVIVLTERLRSSLWLWWSLVRHSLWLWMIIMHSAHGTPDVYGGPGSHGSHVVPSAHDNRGSHGRYSGEDCNGDHGCNMSMVIGHS